MLIKQQRNYNIVTDRGRVSAYVNLSVMTLERWLFHAVSDCQQITCWLLIYWPILFLSRIFTHMPTLFEYFQSIIVYKASYSRHLHLFWTTSIIILIIFKDIVHPFCFICSKSLSAQRFNPMKAHKMKAIPTVIMLRNYATV